MRKVTFSEQEMIERDETKRKETRNTGFSLMKVRDKGFANLKKGGKVYWHFEPRECEPYVLEDGRKITTIITPRVGPGEFGIELGGKMVVFDAEELTKYLRWS